MNNVAYKIEKPVLPRAVVEAIKTAETSRDTINRILRKRIVTLTKEMVVERFTGLNNYVFMRGTLPLHVKFTSDEKPVVRAASTPGVASGFTLEQAEKAAAILKQNGITDTIIMPRSQAIQFALDEARREASKMV